jgi:hypothetical protein
VQPDLVERGMELADDWVFIPPAGFPVPADLPAATLPPGFAATLGETAVRWADSSFAKRRLVEVLSQNHQDRILRGHAAPCWTGERVEAVTVHVSATEEEVILSTRALVVAAGCGSKRILHANPYQYGGSAPTPALACLLCQGLAGFATVSSDLHQPSPSRKEKTQDELEPLR